MWRLFNINIIYNILSFLSLILIILLFFILFFTPLLSHVFSFPSPSPPPSSFWLVSWNSLLIIFFFRDYFRTSIFRYFSVWARTLFGSIDTGELSLRAQPALRYADVLTVSRWNIIVWRKGISKRVAVLSLWRTSLIPRVALPSVCRNATCDSSPGSFMGNIRECRVKEGGCPWGLATEMMLLFSLLESLGMPVVLNYLLRRAALKCTVHISIHHRLCFNSIIISTTYT